MIGRWWLREAYASRRFLWPLWPLGYLYQVIMSIRAWSYRHGVLRVTEVPVPVWVIGNITLGGTGKTALLIHLLRYCQEQGIKAGVVSRGYGGQRHRLPLIVQADHKAQEVGDEAVLIAKQSACPMVVGVDRVAAAKHLLAHFACDVIVSDDGLQHLAMARQVEVCLVDGDRGLGNGWCLPAGPLRESPARLDAVDAVVFHGGDVSRPYRMTRMMEKAYAMHQCSDRRLIASWAGQDVQLVTAIGNPDRLVSNLEAKGLRVMNPRFLPDHARIPIGVLRDLRSDQPIFITEKDATKIPVDSGLLNIWVIEENLQLSDQLARFIEKMCYTLKDASN